MTVVAARPLPAPPAVAAALAQSLSEQRLRPYRAAAGGGGLPAALRLYRWNSAVSAAFFEVLGAVEVTVRNALDAELAGLAVGGPWWRRPWWDIEPGRARDLAAAVARSAGSRDRDAAVLARLSFGWWTDLLAPRQDELLWGPALRHAFPGLTDGRGRADVHEPLSRLGGLRNAVAHHEPVVGRDLAALHDDAMVVLAAVCPVTRSWAERTSRVPGVLEQDPRQTARCETRMPSGAPPAGRGPSVR